MTLEQAKKRISQHSEDLRKEFHIEALYLFGSIVSNQRLTPPGDIDILVEFSSSVGLFDFVKLRDRLQEILKTDVDLVTRDGLKEWMKESIEKDLVRAA